MEITVLGLLMIILYLIWSYFSIHDLIKNKVTLAEISTTIWLAFTSSVIFLFGGSLLIDYISTFDWSFLHKTLIRI